MSSREIVPVTRREFVKNSAEAAVGFVLLLTGCGRKQPSLIPGMSDIQLTAEAETDRVEEKAGDRCPEGFEFWPFHQIGNPKTILWSGPDQLKFLRLEDKVPDPSDAAGSGYIALVVKIEVASDSPSGFPQGTNETRLPLSERKDWRYSLSKFGIEIALVRQGAEGGRPGICYRRVETE